MSDENTSNINNSDNNDFEEVEFSASDIALVFDQMREAVDSLEDLFYAMIETHVEMQKEHEEKLNKLRSENFEFVKQVSQKYQELVADDKKDKIEKES